MISPNLRQGTVLVVMVGLSTILIGLILTLNLNAKHSLDSSRTAVKQAQAIIMANAMIAYLSPYWDTTRTPFATFGSSPTTLTSDPGLSPNYVTIPDPSLTGTRTDLGNNFSGAKYMGAAYYGRSGSTIYVAGIGGPGYPASISTSFDASAKNTGLATQMPPFDCVLWLEGTTSGNQWTFIPSDGINAQSLTNAPVWRIP